MSFVREKEYGYDRDVTGYTAAFAAGDERAAFIRRTYTHLTAAIFLFIAIEAAIFTLVPAAVLQNTIGTMLSGRFSVFIVMGLFMGVSWIARSWAESNAGPAWQYLGLGLYAVAQALIFVPILLVASRVAPNAIPAAGLLTAFVFAGLTAYVFLTKADFSGWGQYLWWAGIASCGVVIAAVVFQFSLGVWFSAGMVGLLSAYILYDTSNVLHRYNTTQHVAAALALFASVATLFFYILRIMMELNRGGRE